ncbi:MAG TPA: hypothetical protein DDY13_01610 [Cytophagales bacterium]|nr:hypothetical protein [Cytophagales bacterium]
MIISLSETIFKPSINQILRIYKLIFTSSHNLQLAGIESPNNIIRDVFVSPQTIYKHSYRYDRYVQLDIEQKACAKGHLSRLTERRFIGVVL